MGRGRQKAKNTKVARELKYFSPSTNYNALEAELASKAPAAEPDYEDKWADLYADEDEDDTEGEGQAQGQGQSQSQSQGQGQGQSGQQKSV